MLLAAAKYLHRYRQLKYKQTKLPTSTCITYHILAPKKNSRGFRLLACFVFDLETALYSFNFLFALLSFY